MSKKKLALKNGENLKNHIKFIFPGVLAGATPDLREKLPEQEENLSNTGSDADFEGNFHRKE